MSSVSGADSEGDCKSASSGSTREEYLRNRREKRQDRALEARWYTAENPAFDAKFEQVRASAGSSWGSLFSLSGVMDMFWWYKYVAWFNAHVAVVALLGAGALWGLLVALAYPQWLCLALDLRQGVSALLDCTASSPKSDQADDEQENAAAGNSADGYADEDGLAATREQLLKAGLGKYCSEEQIKSFGSMMSRFAMQVSEALDVRLCAWLSNAFSSYCVLFFLGEPQVALMRCWVVLQVLWAWVLVVSPKWEKNAIYLLTMLAWSLQLCRWHHPPPLEGALPAAQEASWMQTLFHFGALEHVMVLGTALIYARELLASAQTFLGALKAKLRARKSLSAFCSEREPQLLLYSAAHFGALHWFMRPQWSYFYVCLVQTALWCHWQLALCSTTRVWTVRNEETGEQQRVPKEPLWSSLPWQAALVLLGVCVSALWYQSATLFALHAALFVALYTVPAVHPQWLHVALRSRVQEVVAAFARSGPAAS